VDRQAYRTFAVDRMSQLVCDANQPFTPGKAFNLTEWVESCWIAMPDSATETVTLAFEYETGLDIAQSFWHQSQHFEIPEDGTQPVMATFLLSMASLETEFRGWIRSFGPKVTILSPHWLIDKG
jgi:predicted DNA-binding transcriptional regulator YafY